MKRFNDFFKKIFFPNDTKPNVKITDSIPDAMLIINVYFNAIKKLSEINIFIIWGNCNPFKIIISKGENASINKKNNKKYSKK